MNFDELKKQWDNQSTEDVVIDSDLENKRYWIEKANNPIKKLRKQIQFDFFTSIFLMIIFVLLVYFLNILTEIRNIILISISITFLFGVYYGVKMYRFYKHSSKLDYNSKDSLLWFYYEGKLLVEMIRSYSFINFFIGLITGYICGGILGKSYSSDTLDSYLNSFSITSFIIGIVVIFIVTFVGVEFLIRIAYSRYLKQIKQILNQLEE